MELMNYLEEKEPEFKFFGFDEPIKWKLRMSTISEIIRDYEKSKTLKFKIRLFFLKIKWFLFDKKMLKL